MKELTPEQIQSLKEILLEEKAHLERQQTIWKIHSVRLNNELELSTSDNHAADQGTDLFEQERDYALFQRRAEQLNGIEHALMKIEQGHYGKCTVCQQPISFARLEAVPTTLYCKTHIHDTIQQDQHPEPGGALRPYYRLFNCDDKSAVAYDGEDSWQDVEKDGNVDWNDFPHMDPEEDNSMMSVDRDELHGFVEPIESFLATDITGNKVYVVKNGYYQKLMKDMDMDAEDSDDTY